MMASATYPTAYGVSVPVFEHPDTPGEYLFSAEATAICAGIHDPKQRARFVADVTAAGRCNMDRLVHYGGGKPQRLALPRPENPASQIHDIYTATPIDAWVTALMDETRWCDRADVLLQIIDDNLNQEESFNPILSLGLQIMLTSALEHLTESEIDCLEAAAFYALTVHNEWVGPAIDWLRPMSGTWFKDWVAGRPAYRRFARVCRKIAVLPVWISGGRN